MQPPATEAKRRLNRRRVRILLLALATALLFALLFVQAAFNTLNWLRPSSVGETLSLYVLSTINFLAFVVLLMVLVRNIIKLRRERLQKKLGARFKTRLVIFFIALSLLPVIFLFFATTGLINRSIDKWFGLPANEMLTNAWQIQNAYVEGEQDGLHRTAVTLARLVANTERSRLNDLLSEELDNQQLIFSQVYTKDGVIIARQSELAEFGEGKLGGEFRVAVQQVIARALTGEPFNTQVSDEENKTICLIASVPLPAAEKAAEKSEAEPSGALVIAQQISPKLVGSVNKIREFKDYYESLQSEQKTLKITALQTLALITLLVLFIAFWLALYVARGIAGSVQQLAQATERIKSGDLSYRADVVGDDELAALALSFNEMTEELSENRRRLELSTEELQLSNAALEERRRYIETVMQSLSAGVISLDENSNVTMINEAALALLRIEQTPAAAVSLESLLPEEQRDELRKMILRAVRLSSVTREVHFTLANQTKLDATVTVTALHDPRGQSRGAVIVIEDLTELIEAQRRAAWSEVARRMAHEIKNPLTPIRLSADRLAKNLLGESNGARPLECLSDRQTKLVRECTSMIDAEVATLQRMVDEFSNFARLPNARLETASLNEVVEKTLKLYDERLNGIRLESRLAPAISPVSIDGEQIKRLLVNLIENAAEALADAANKNGADHRITVSTREVVERETVELIVSDSGPGIPLEDRERIFDPYFSTRKHGAGLGLAIVSRIVAEHQGRIRVQENWPHGARFIVELPKDSK